MIASQHLHPFRRAVEYLESHLTQPASIAEVAYWVGYSRHHFSRTFASTTGITPIAYLRKRRLAEAARELVQSTKPILEIALDYQFQSQEAFSRSFKEEFGVSPGLYRARGQVKWLFSKITLGASRILYPGRGIDARARVIVPEHQLIAVLIPPSVHGKQRMISMQYAPSVHSETVNIRQATRQDIPALCRLYHTLHQDMVRGVSERLKSLGEWESYNAAWLSNELEKILNAVDVSILVAELSGQVVGLAEVYLRQDEPRAETIAIRYGYLQSLVVDQRLRGRGVGKQLLRAAEAWAKVGGASELVLEIWEFEQGPLEFYRQNGYRSLRRALVRKL